MPRAGRVLGIDPGRVRMGLAMSDPTGVVAQGLPTLLSRGRAKDLEALVAVVREREIAEIVVGWPRNLDGSEAAMTSFAERLAEDLRKTTGLSVRLWDERLTSAQAERTLLENNVKRDARRRHRDQLAAVLILEGFLDWRRLQEST